MSKPNYRCLSKIPALAGLEGQRVRTQGFSKSSASHNSPLHLNLNKLTPNLDSNSDHFRSEQRLQNGWSLRERLKVTRNHMGMIKQLKPKARKVADQKFKKRSYQDELDSTRKAGSRQAVCLTDRSSPHQVDWSEPDWIKELKEINQSTSDTKLALNLSRIQNKTFQEQISTELRILSARSSGSGSSSRVKSSLIKKSNRKKYFPPGFFCD